MCSEQVRSLVENEPGISICVVYTPPELIFPNNDDKTVNITAEIIEGLCGNLYCVRTVILRSDMLHSL